MTMDDSNNGKHKPIQVDLNGWDFVEKPKQEKIQLTSMKTPIKTKLALLYFLMRNKIQRWLLPRIKKRKGYTVYRVWDNDGATAIFCNFNVELGNIPPQTERLVAVQNKDLFTLDVTNFSSKFLSEKLNKMISDEEKQQ